MTSDSPYWLVVDEAGYPLQALPSGTRTSALADDACMWIRSGTMLHSVSTNLALESMPSESGRYRLKANSGDDDTTTLPGSYTVEPGPSRLPSIHLQEISEHGFTVLDNILDLTAIDRLKSAIAENRAQNFPEEPPCDGHFWMMDGLTWSADLARAATHPVALWLLQQYLATDDIHFCHQPIITTLKPADKLTGTLPEGGWHSDYPYHPGVFPDEDWPVNPVYGAQFNICLDAFTPASGATQFIPGSHQRGCWPPSELNLGGTHAGDGIHAEVRQLQAPAGAALLYDARTWHRACHELNVSGRDRIALLNAVAPSWVQPMIDKAPIAEKYAVAEIEHQLSERVARDIQRLCNSPTGNVPDDALVLATRREPRRSSSPGGGP